MLFAVFGDPSQNALLGLRTIQTLTEVSKGPYHWICVATAEELLAALRGGENMRTVFFSDSPDHRISSLFLEMGIPFVIFVNTPDSIRDSLIASRGLEPLVAARVTSMCLSSLHNLAVSPGAYLVAAPVNAANLTPLLASFAEIYGIPVNQHILNETMRRLGPLEGIQPRTGSNVTSASSGNQVPEPDSLALSECLKGFECLLAKEPVSQMCWPREVFLDPARDGAPLREAIDLTGPARLLFYGPFLHLPPGCWIATVMFEISGNSSGNALKIDVYNDGVAGEWECEMPRDGAYMCDLRLDVAEPRHPLQIRFYSKQGAIEGLFDLKLIHLRRA